MHLYSVKDAKSQIFGQIFSARHKSEAVRQLSVVANDGQSMLSRYPSDFELWCLGTMDETTGIITPAAEFIVGVQTLKEAVNG